MRPWRSPQIRSLTDVIGSRITRVRRVQYVYRGVPDTDFGPFELTFGARVVLLDNASDGEELRVRTEPWEDPFVEPLSEENRAFVETSGKWTAFDVSTVGAFATFTVTFSPALSQFSLGPAK